MQDFLRAGNSSKFALFSGGRTAVALINKLLKKHAKNKGLVAGLKKMRGRCRRALKEPATPAGYASLFYIVDIIEGEFHGYEFYVTLRS